MRRLTIIGTTPNGDGVVLSDDKGAKFIVENDPRLVAVSGHDLSRQLEMALQSFSPREIQARVRGGDSAEVIAAETGWPLDKVLRYAEPLLAERAYIAEQAQRVEVRRSGGGATLLESAVAQLGGDPDAAEIAWDALRREDGKWVVTATFRERKAVHTARWSYDHVGRNVHPLDDDARTLMGARPVPVPDVDLDIADALDLVADVPVVRTAKEPRPRLVAVPDATEDDSPDESAPDDQADDRATAAPTHSEPTVTIPSVAETTTAGAAQAKAPAKKAAAPKPKARKGRASVPSWDEILFGATRTDD